MFIYQTSGLFGLYLSRPISTVVKVKHKTVSQNKSVLIYLLQIHSTTLHYKQIMKWNKLTLLLKKKKIVEKETTKLAPMRHTRDAPTN